MQVHAVSSGADFGNIWEKQKENHLKSPSVRTG